MTQRPFLEKASWVAGIASAIIATVVWLKPSSPVEASSAKSAETKTAAPAPKPVENTATPSSPSTEPKAEKSTRWSCEGIATDLQPAFAAAKNISYTAPRDEAFLNLARKALCLENYAMFEEAAKQIAYTAPRDQAYRDAVDFALGVRKFDLAEKFVGQIAYTAPRDAARARIAAKSSER